MIDSTLLLPDSGPDFLRALNLAALYSEEVHTFAFTKPETAQSLENSLRSVDEISKILEAVDTFGALIQGRSTGITDEKAGSPEMNSALVYSSGGAHAFAKFTVENASLLSLAEREGVLHSITEFACAQMQSDKEGVKSLLGVFSEIISVGKNRSPDWLGNSMDLFRRTVLQSPPSLPLLLERLFSCAVRYGRAADLVPEDVYKDIASQPEVLLSAATASYFLLAGFYSLSRGVGGVTWQESTHDCFQLCTDYVRHGMPSVNELLTNRRAITGTLGRMILEEEVPDVADLPFEEILELRRRRRPELLAFRDGLRLLATDIDPSLDAKMLELKLDSTIQRVFRPAVRDLRTSICELDRDMMGQLFHPSKELGAALIPVAIALSAGAAPETTVTVGAIGAAIAKLYEFTVGKEFAKKKELGKSNWSILFYLEKEIMERRKSPK